MIWLAAHMWILLFLAFFTGLGTGWWIWAAQSGKASLMPTETTMGSLDSDGEVASGDL